MSVKAVKSMHCLHLWALTVGQALVSVHLAIGKVTQPSTNSKVQQDENTGRHSSQVSRAEQTNLKESPVKTDKGGEENTIELIPI